MTSDHFGRGNDAYKGKTSKESEESDESTERTTNIMKEIKCYEQ